MTDKEALTEIVRQEPRHIDKVIPCRPLSERGDSSSCGWVDMI